MNMDFKRKLTIPMETKEMYPLTGAISATVEKRTAELKAIFSGQSDRLALIIGPCSADNEDSVMDYISRLVPVQEKVKDRILIVPRIYTNKPRTTGEGYKGLVHQPDPNARPDLFKGIIATRELHMRAVRETGFACADEMLYPENYKYLDDLLGYVAVGARSVEDQQHRLTASAIECPVGMKNPTSGDLTVMMNGILAAQHAHDFIYRGWEGHSYGNPFAHAILRGYVNRQGVTHPNYHYETLLYLAELYGKWELRHPAVVIDCNHANSGKNPFEQPRILKEVLHSCRYNPEVKRLVKGFMVESYIEDGSQPVGGGVYGKSITDACLGWEKSERLIYEMADML
ncbi:MAG: 3-deoxy-7-phosphoheptulonate synthase [Oscillospiraceae bacterium]|nr:3-deoxy-7-phosphoheptulonate synthase [Oscillospiraceae bacterium]